MINEYAFARLTLMEQERLLRLFGSRPPRSAYPQLQVDILKAVHCANVFRHEAVFAENMEALFGTEELCGVLLQLDEETGPGPILTLAEYYNFAPDERPATVTLLANGGDGCCCTHYAYLVHQRLPGRVQIYGFANEDNAGAKAAQWAPGGHDFAVVDDRYIVDPWARHVHYQADMPFVHEIGTDNTVRIYGPRTAWTLNTEAVPFYDEHLKPILPTSQQPGAGITKRISAARLAQANKPKES